MPYLALPVRPPPDLNPDTSLVTGSAVYMARCLLMGGRSEQGLIWCLAIKGQGRPELLPTIVSLTLLEKMPGLGCPGKSSNKEDEARLAPSQGCSYTVDMVNKFTLRSQIIQDSKRTHTDDWGIFTEGTQDA